MQPDQLYKVALATVCSIAAILAIGLLVRGLFMGATALVDLVSG